MLDSLLKVHHSRSLAEWSFIYRRRNVLRAIRHPRLTANAKQVLVHLSLRNDDPFILPEQPPISDLARHLGLPERSVRQAFAELIEEGCLTFRHTGEVYRPGETPPDDGSRPDLNREAAFLAEARKNPTREEYVEMLAWLRDKALAANRIATAISAERAIGRALGIGRSPRRRRAGNGS